MKYGIQPRIRRFSVLIITVITVCCQSLLREAAAAVPVKSYNPSPSVIYFTFDDGPSQRYTPILLDVLRAYQVQATFFVLGNRCVESPWLVRRIKQEGHEIGSHGYDHRYILHRSPSHIRDEVIRADAAIYKACGARPIYYRPPGGLLNTDERVTIHELGHPIALWTVDSEDWKTTSAETIVRNVELSARSGSIVLFHDGVSNSRYTIQALPTLIRFYRHQGYEFRALPMA